MRKNIVHGLKLEIYKNIEVNALMNMARIINFLTLAFFKSFGNIKSALNPTIDWKLMTSPVMKELLKELWISSGAQKLTRASANFIKKTTIEKPITLDQTGSLRISL